MTIKTLVFAFALVTAASAAMAEEATVAPSAPAASGQDYWLSNRLNRLVFWKAPMQSGRSVATDPAKH